MKLKKAQIMSYYENNVDHTVSSKGLGISRERENCCCSGAASRLKAWVLNDNVLLKGKSPNFLDLGSFRCKMRFRVKMISQGPPNLNILWVCKILKKWKLPLSSLTYLCSLWYASLCDFCSRAVIVVIGIWLYKLIPAKHLF